MLGGAMSVFCMVVADPRFEPVPGIGHDAGMISRVLLSGQLRRPGAQISLLTRQLI